MWLASALLGSLGELFVILGNTEHYRLGVSVLHLHGAARFRQYSGSFDVPLRGLTVIHALAGRLFPQSSSASRLTAGAFGFLTFTQCGDRPER